jgi:hypothetical protein
MTFCAIRTTIEISLNLHHLLEGMRDSKYLKKWVSTNSIHPIEVEKPEMNGVRRAPLFLGTCHFS